MAKTLGKAGGFSDNEAVGNAKRSNLPLDNYILLMRTKAYNNAYAERGFYYENNVKYRRQTA